MRKAGEQKALEEIAAGDKEQTDGCVNKAGDVRVPVGLTLRYALIPGHSPADYKLLSVQVLIRHGDRYPLYAIPKTKRPAIDCTLDPHRGEEGKYPGTSTWDRVCTSGETQVGRYVGSEVMVLLTVLYTERRQEAHGGRLGDLTTCCSPIVDLRWGGQMDAVVTDMIHTHFVCAGSFWSV
ncbi:hypothetical protein Z043_124452 [Scleropages formosus]|uniref:2-phosphoxylose phosphatase 1 n=1 Tax=Scleropages formosus TaxID=113540 RepID=A0A0P7UCD6_SCLFO|nr:hypothetical protein Z043_124452 [Scleropages formosus]